MGGLGCGLRLGIGESSGGVVTPDLFQLVGEHASSFGIKSRRRGAHSFGKASPLPPQGGLQRIEFWGEYPDAQSWIRPRLAGNPARPNTAGFGFSGLSFSESHSRERRPVRDSRQ